jgi:hypothetical protein
VAKSTFPWRDGRPLSNVLADSRRWLQRKRIIRNGGGCRESVLADAEKRLGQPLPSDVREFHREAQPVPMFKDGDLSDDGPGEFYFYSPDQPQMKWHSLSEWVPSPDWSRAQGLAIGQTGYGDTLFWVKGHRVHQDGCIAVDDHEISIGDLQYAVLARSLSELIAKVVRLKGLSPGLGDDLDDLEDEDEDDDLGEDEGDDVFGLADQDLFDREYGELNRASEKGRPGKN